MGSRERKRIERQKRKRRSVEREAPSATGTAQPSRSELRNREAREAQEPLRKGERPTAVTVGAIASAVLALVFTGSAIVAAIGSVEISGREPSPCPLALFAAVLWGMAWGMWRARYWAVLGFQMLLVLFMLSSAAGLVGASTILLAVGAVIQLLAAGALFYFLIRAMARIQMPERPGDR